MKMDVVGDEEEVVDVEDVEDGEIDVDQMMVGFVSLYYVFYGVIFVIVLCCVGGLFCFFLQGFLQLRRKVD